MSSPDIGTEIFNSFFPNPDIPYRYVPRYPRLIPSPKARLSTGQKLNRIAELRAHPLLTRFNNETDLPLEFGELVWAKEQGAVYWPAYISTLEDEKTPGESELLQSMSSVYVVYLEPKFRVSIIPHSRLIRVDVPNIEEQKELVELLNRLEKSSKRKANSGYKAFHEALQLLDEFIVIEPDQRHLSAIKVFATTLAAKKEAQSSKKIKLDKPPGETETGNKNDVDDESGSTVSSMGSASTDATAKKPSTSPPPTRDRRKSTYGLRQKIPNIQRWDCSGPQTLSKSQLNGSAQDISEGPKPPSSISGVSDSGTSTGAISTISNSEVRRKLSGDELKQWASDVFDDMDKQYKFDIGTNLKCSECREDFDVGEVISYCHDYPYHKKCLAYYPVKNDKKRENVIIDEAKKNGTSTPQEDPESDPSSSSDLELPASVPSLSQPLEPELKLKCQDCGKQRCFICKKDNDETSDLPTKCSRCDLRFHRDCLAFKWPMSEVVGSKYSITCPLHFCHVCKAEHKSCGKVRNYKLTAAKAVRCLYCMATYHKASCVPAGCGQSLMPNNFMICPRHYGKESMATKKQKLFGCTLCSKKLIKADKMLACNICPLMFHFNCVHGDSDFSEETMENLSRTFECEACVVGNFPLYGQVVWFQQPGSLYWPAFILYPRDSANREGEGVGMFSVRYCGYPIQFFDQGRCFQALPFEIGTKDFLKKLNLFSNPRVKSAAEEAFHLIKLSERRRETLLGTPEPLYRKIDRNLIRDANPSLNSTLPRGNTRGKNGKKSASGMVAGRVDHEDCNCGQKSKTGDVCTPNSNCYNRALSVECSDKNCTGGPRCRNRMFTTKTDQIEDSLECFVSSTSKGFGLRTNKDIENGTFVIEYVGEVISKDERTWRIERKLTDDPLYFLEIDSGSFIDAEYYGNLSRLINHSCSPNCHTAKYHSALGKPVIGIFASRDIEAGEELTFDYNYGPDAKFAFKCRCKGEGCKGYIGRARGDKENTEPGASSSSQVHANSDWKWEDECAQCGMRGELLMCDFTGCKLAYHHQCINLASTPKGNWYCPKHPIENKKTFPPRGKSLQ